MPRKENGTLVYNCWNTSTAERRLKKLLRKYKSLEGLVAAGPFTINTKLSPAEISDSYEDLSKHDAEVRKRQSKITYFAC